LHGLELHPHAAQSPIEDPAGFVTPDRPRGPSTAGPRTGSGDCSGAMRPLNLDAASPTSVDAASPTPSTGEIAPAAAPLTAPVQGGVTTRLQRGIRNPKQRTDGTIALLLG
jgi:hypothetical protein